MEIEKRKGPPASSVHSYMEKRVPAGKSQGQGKAALELPAGDVMRAMMMSGEGTRTPPLRGALMSLAPMTRKLVLSATRFTTSRFVGSSGQSVPVSVS
jgi:hypothetical protein